MATTFTKIASVSVGSGGAATIDFTSIPATFTDLKVVYSIRTTAGTVYGSGNIQFNSDTGNNYSWRYIRGDGASAASSNGSAQPKIYAGEQDGDTATASVFSNGEAYIPNYLSANQKSVSIDVVMENNATTAYAHLVAGLWSGTAAITTVSLVSDQTIKQYSSATLYGIKNS